MLTSKEFATVEATHDFDPSTLGLNRAKSRTLMVLKGDRFNLFSMPNRDWWGARCTTNDLIGYIPAAYVTPVSEMDAAAIAAIAREVKINSRAKQTQDDAPSTELGNILQQRQHGAGGPIKPKKSANPDDGMSSELKALLQKRTKIIEEDEAEREKQAAEPEFRKFSLRKTGVSLDGGDEENIENEENS